MDSLGVAIVRADASLRNEECTWSDADAFAYSLYTEAKRHGFSDMTISVALVYGQRIVLQLGWPLPVWFPVCLSLACKTLMDGTRVSDVSGLLPLEYARAFCRTYYEEKTVVVTFDYAGAFAYRAFDDASKARSHLLLCRAKVGGGGSYGLFRGGVDLLRGTMTADQVDWYVRVVMLRRFEYLACVSFDLFDMGRPSFFVHTCAPWADTVFESALAFRNALLLTVEWEGRCNATRVSLLPKEVAPGRRPTVTVVDDDVFHRCVMEEHLSKLGIDATLFESMKDLEEEEWSAPFSTTQCEDEDEEVPCHIYLLDMEDETSRTAGVGAANRLHERDRSALVAFVTGHDTSSEEWKEIMEGVRVPFVTSYEKGRIGKELPSILRFGYK